MTPVVDDNDALAAAPAAAAAGDEAAFRLLYRNIQPMLLRYLTVIAGSEAEDVASEAWLQICRDLPAFRGDDRGFRAWCFAIARHRAMDHLRHLRRRPQSAPSDEHLAEVADPDDTARIATDSVTTREVIALIASLTPAEAEAVFLRVVVGLDPAAAAKVLGRRPGAVRTACYRGLRRLADRLDPDAG